MQEIDVAAKFGGGVNVSFPASSSINVGVESASPMNGVPTQSGDAIVGVDVGVGVVLMELLSK